MSNSFWWARLVVEATAEATGAGEGTGGAESAEAAERAEAAAKAATTGRMISSSIGGARRPWIQLDNKDVSNVDDSNSRGDRFQGRSEEERTSIRPKRAISPDASEVPYSPKARLHSLAAFPRGPTKHPPAEEKFGDGGEGNPKTTDGGDVIVEEPHCERWGRRKAGTGRGIEMGWRALANVLGLGMDEKGENGSECDVYDYR